MERVALGWLFGLSVGWQLAVGLALKNIIPSTAGYDLSGAGGIGGFTFRGGFSQPGPALTGGSTFNFASGTETATRRHAFDFDVLIVGCGVGGHGAALQAVSRGLRTAVLTGGDTGGTCVNRGCIPSKALLAVAGELHSMADQTRLQKLGIRIDGSVRYDRESVAKHSSSLVRNLRQELEKSLVRHGVTVTHEKGKLIAPHRVQLESHKVMTAQDIILAPGSVPAIPPGIQVDEERVFTSDRAVELHEVPEWIAIVGSGYIGFEFADIYSSLGAEVTLIDAADRVLPTFDPELAKIAERLILKPRGIEVRTGVIASNITYAAAVTGSRREPVAVQLKDIKTGKPSDTLEVDAVLIATGRRPRTEGLGLESVDVEVTAQKFVPVNDHMQVMTRGGTAVPNLYCIGDANGKLMLAHAASAQGAAVVENIVFGGGPHSVVNHQQVPAACFTHPEIASVGLSEQESTEFATATGAQVGKATAHFRANSKALAELESGGLLKLLYRQDTGHVLGAHIIGPHAADLIQQVANAMTANATVTDLSYSVHAHPTFSEVLLDAYKQAAGLLPH